MTSAGGGGVEFGCRDIETVDVCENGFFVDGALSRDGALTHADKLGDLVWG